MRNENARKGLVIMPALGVVARPQAQRVLGEKTEPWVTLSDWTPARTDLSRARAGGS